MKKNNSTKQAQNVERTKEQMVEAYKTKIAEILSSEIWAELNDEESLSRCIRMGVIECDDETTFCAERLYYNTHFLQEVCELGKLTEALATEAGSQKDFDYEEAFLNCVLKALLTVFELKFLYHYRRISPYNRPFR